MASWSFLVADTGMDCTHFSAGKDPILSPRRRQGADILVGLARCQMLKQYKEVYCLPRTGNNYS